MIGISGALIWSKTPVANFGEVQRVHLAKPTLLTSALVPLGSFQIFLGVRKATGSYRTYSSLIKLLPWFLRVQCRTCPCAKMQPRLLRLRSRTCPWAEHSDDDDDDYKYKDVHKVRVPLVPQLVNHLLCETTACT